MVYLDFDFLKSLSLSLHSFYILYPLIFTCLSLVLPIQVHSLTIPHSVGIPSKHGGTLYLLLSKREYSQFQISEGYGGSALDQAAALFEEPLKGIALENVPYTIYEHLNLMWEAIEYANIISFPQQVEDAQITGDDQLASALDVGWTKNDVLMKMVQVQLAKIRIAKNAKDGTDTWEDEQTLKINRDNLMVAVAADKSNSGLVSQAVELVYEI